MRSFQGFVLYSILKAKVKLSLETATRFNSLSALLAKVSLRSGMIFATSPLSCTKISRPFLTYWPPFGCHFPACAGPLDHIFQSAQVSPWPHFSAFASPPPVAFLSLREPASGHALEYAHPPFGHRFPTRTLTLIVFLLIAHSHLSGQRSPPSPHLNFVSRHASAACIISKTKKKQGTNLIPSHPCPCCHL